mgnify:CR=1 FL=1
MSDKIPNIESDHSQKRELVRLNKEVVAWLTFEQRLDTRERLQSHLDRAKVILDNMLEIFNSFDLDKTARIPWSELLAFQLAQVSRFEVSSQMLLKILENIKSTKIWLSESEVNLILSYEKLYFDYNDLMTDRITKDYTRRMNSTR